MSKQISLSEKHLIQLKDLLANHAPDAEVWAYGSRVRGDGHETSDLDIVLRNRSDLTQPTSGLSDLVEAIQQSTIPVIIDVHDWASLPESFHEEIKKEYAVIR